MIRARHYRHLPAWVALIAIPVIASADDRPMAAQLARCSAIGGREARLACYDQLAGRAPDTTKQAPMAAPDRVKGQGSAAPAVADDDPRNFGLSQSQIHTTPQGPASVQGTIVSLVRGQPGAHGYVVLDNGQTWVFTDTDEDQRMRTGDTVTIRRAALGSFVLSSTSSKRTYHVRRTH